MMQALSKKVYRLKQNKKIRLSFWVVFAVVGLQCSNMMLLELLQLPNVAWPWSFIIVLHQHLLLPVVVSFGLVLLPLIAGLLWLIGGVKRAIAQNMLLVWLALMILSWFGLALFRVWSGVNIPLDLRVIMPLLIRLPTSSTEFQHLVISLLASYSLLLIALAFKYCFVKTAAENVFGKAHFSTAAEIHRAGFYTNSGLVIGSAYGQTLRLPGFESLLVVAPTGSGKTSAIAVPNLLEWSDSGVFNDLKGELYRLTATHRSNKLNNTCFLWAPADVNKQSTGYNPFFYVSDHPDLRIRDLQLIAETLIPATKLGDGFWYQSSRELFLTLSLYLLETQGMATLSQVHDLSKQQGFFCWLYDQVSENEETFSKFLKQNAYAILDADEKTQKNILKDFHSRMQLFNDPLVGFATRQNDFDFRELRRKKMSIYIHIPDSDKERLSPILTLFWTQLINALSSQEPQADEPYGVLALLDEFGNMARINKLKEGMSFLRSYRVRCIIIVQYLGQILSVYGREDAKGFLNSKVKIAFAVNDVDDAQFFSKILGSKTVKVTSSSVSTGYGNNAGSRSASCHYQSRALMTADELMKLSSKKQIIMIEAKHPIKADKCYWFKNQLYQQKLGVRK